jgi:hypothetical protein
MATQVQNRRLIRDAAATMTLTKVLPAAGATNQTGTIDLGTGPWHPEELTIEVSIPALAAHTDTTKNVTLTLQDSADDSSYANTDSGTNANPAITITTPGVASTGTAARVVTVHIPPGVRRYLQFTQAVTSGGPTLTASSITYSVLN